jgi:hypothetical protein
LAGPFAFHLDYQFAVSGVYFDSVVDAYRQPKAIETRT